MTFHRDFVSKRLIFAYEVYQNSSTRGRFPNLLPSTDAPQGDWTSATPSFHAMHNLCFTPNPWPQHYVVLHRAFGLFPFPFRLTDPWCKKKTTYARMVLWSISKDLKVAVSRKNLFLLWAREVFNNVHLHFRLFVAERTSYSWVTVTNKATFKLL